ncbi:hypothetical protein [Streptomyces sp. NPDC001076]
MTWRWEYAPAEEYVVGGAPPALVAEIEKRADELVRAAAAFYLDGASCQEAGPKGTSRMSPADSSGTWSSHGTSVSTSTR